MAMMPDASGRLNAESGVFLTSPWRVAMTTKWESRKSASRKSSLRSARTARTRSSWAIWIRLRRLRPFAVRVPSGTL